MPRHFGGFQASNGPRLGPNDWNGLVQDVPLHRQSVRHGILFLYPLSLPTSSELLTWTHPSAPWLSAFILTLPWLPLALTAPP